MRWRRCLEDATVDFVSAFVRVRAHAGSCGVCFTADRFSVVGLLLLLTCESFEVWSMKSENSHTKSIYINLRMAYTFLTVLMNASLGIESET
jgi:hypothetical protein